jgi:ZIP family zinc transporter
VVATIMAVGAGVLMSAVAFELVDEAYQQAGMLTTTAGAVAYTGCNILLARRGARHRKRSGDPTTFRNSTIRLGYGHRARRVARRHPRVDSDRREPARRQSGRRRDRGRGVHQQRARGPVQRGRHARRGRSSRYVFGRWGGIAAVSGLAAVAGYTLLGGAPAAVLAGITALAAGAILAMVADTMIPEAFQNAHLLIGLVTVAGFLVAFGLSHAGG